VIGEFILVGLNNFRTYFYLKSSLEHGWPCRKVIIYGKDTLDISNYLNSQFILDGFSISIDMEIEELLKNFVVEYYVEDNFNKLFDSINQEECRNILFSGAGKVSKEFVTHFQVIHAHPGKLPEYKGSTTFYYSLLKEQMLYCSTFIMNEKLDSGEILNEVQVPLEECRNIPIDDILDPLVRAKCINELMMSSSQKHNERFGNKNHKIYYKIHPVLRKILLNKLSNHMS
jgi:methionyl-tRNA formyltransferase